jgi:outer membrane protein assembly factor BamB
VLSYNPTSFARFMSTRTSLGQWFLSRVSLQDGLVLWSTDLGRRKWVTLLSSSGKTVFALTNEDAFTQPNKIVAVDKEAGRVLWR